MEIGKEYLQRPGRVGVGSSLHRLSEYEYHTELLACVADETAMSTSQ